MAKMVDPTANDVLFGMRAATKPGNQKLREWCLRRKGKYQGGNNVLKRRIVDEIYDKCCNKGMRFLKKHDNSWHELSKENADTKIRYVIRSFDKKSSRGRSEVSPKPGKQGSVTYSKPDGALPTHNEHLKQPSVADDVAGKRRVADRASEDGRLFKKPKIEMLKEPPCEEKCVDTFREAIVKAMKLHRQEVRQIRADLLAENEELKNQLDLSNLKVYELEAKLRENQTEYDAMALKLKDYETENSKFRQVAKSVLFEENNLIDKMKDGCGMEAHDI